NVRFRTTLDLPHMDNIAGVDELQGENLARTHLDGVGLKGEFSALDLNGTNAFWQFRTLRSDPLGVIVPGMPIAAFRAKTPNNIAAPQHTRPVVRIAHRGSSLDP